MPLLPRLALATSSQELDPSPASLALLAGLTARRWKVQHFRTRACLTATEAVGQISGLPGRHLDAWLMPPDLCRTVFARGAYQADLAVVEGTLDGARPEPGRVPLDSPGDLGPIAEALDLPRVALIECRRSAGFHLPQLPPDIDAVLLDGLERPEDFEALRSLVGMILKRPVLGAVEALPAERAALRSAPRDWLLPQELSDRLAASFLRFADLEAIRTLARSRPFPEPPCAHQPRCGGRFRVAYAQDEAFGRYFPDTLETLEAFGAELIEFSPLRDETLPDQADLVILGCGYTDQYAEELASNLSLITALRAHICRGHRIYSEGGGTAYLGRSMRLSDGRVVPMAGILPFDAILRRRPVGPTPVTRILTRDSWLGPRGTTVRGYRSGRWYLRPAPDPGDCPARSGTLTRRRDLFFRHHAVGSLIHLHLAALPEVVSAFTDPHRPSLVLRQTRG